MPGKSAYLPKRRNDRRRKPKGSRRKSGRGSRRQSAGGEPIRGSATAKLIFAQNAEGVLEVTAEE